MELKVLQQSELKNNVAAVLGTRPEIIKLGPVILALKQQRKRFFIIHTGQHYSMNMDGQFFKDLGLPRPRFSYRETQRRRPGRGHGRQTADMICFVEDILTREKPRSVVVQGDTNTTLAAALVARKLGISVAHVEAGLRSGDWRMPEEHNRVMVDHISDLLFAPTEGARRHLRREGVHGAISVVGNTVVDAVLDNRKRAARRGILRRLGLNSGEDYFLFTVHREENVDNLKTIKRLRRIFERLSRRFHVPMIFVLHPRTRHRLRFFGQLEPLEKIENLQLVEPVGYLDFTRLLSDCRMAFTDSGGVQEEACILQVPCVTLRDSTERPETVRVRANLLAGMNPEAVTRAAERMLRRLTRWHNPFGDGRSGQRIVRILTRKRV